MSEETSTAVAAAAVAARRRTRKAGNEPPPLPSPPADALDEPAAPNAVSIAKGTVLVAGSLVAEFHAQASHGVTGPRIPAGNLYGTGMQPLVQPMSTAHGTVPHADNYVVAEFDAEESMVPPGCKTPVSRLLWQTGWRVRRDFYEAVLARRSALDQETARLAPAKLPTGVVDPPPAMTVAAASSEITPTPGAPA